MTSSLTVNTLDFSSDGNVNGLETYSPTSKPPSNSTAAVSIQTLNNYLSGNDNVEGIINPPDSNLNMTGTVSNSSPFTGEVTISVKDNPVFNGDVIATGGVTATTFNTSSDERLKTNISPLSNSLENVNKLQGVSYNWIDPNKPQDKQIGLIAQEVEKVYPEFVHTGTDEDKTKSVKYSQMVSVLIESIKDLTNEVSSLKSRITELENK